MSDTLGHFLTTDKICERLGVTPWSLWRMNRDGEGPPRMRINGKSYGYPERLFEEWARSRLVQSNTSK